jgi:hypothetical protein
MIPPLASPGSGHSFVAAFRVSRYLTLRISWNENPSGDVRKRPQSRDGWWHGLIAAWRRARANGGKQTKSDGVRPCGARA